MSERNEWESFLQLRANQAKLTLAESEAFLLRFCQQNLDKEEKDITKILKQDYNSLNNFKKQMTEVYKKFSKRYPEIQSHHHKFRPLCKCLEREYEQWLSTPNKDSSASSKISIDWREICNRMLEPQRRLSSNSLLHADENSKFERQQIYVPLALIERKKPDKREGEVKPEAGTKLYEPEYEEKQRFEHEAFLEQILVKGEGKRKGRETGKQIALIGEPGAGKTTLLQTIADWVLELKLGLPIWISLADLGQQATFDIWNYLQSNWLSVATTPTQKSIAETELEKQIKEGGVWLLLDGVDEVATSGIQTLQAIAQQLRGWLAQSRVILTCRLNVWNADKNALAEFETYRLLDFDYPQQVHQFIDNWFSNGDAEKKKRLKAELDNPEKARLRDLIQNPLRLTLLCASWQSREGNLPETKAGLYAQFVEQFYKWKSDCFTASHEEKIALNQALGRLALQDIDMGTTRFRLRESFIRAAMGDDSLFEKALQLGWLNNVGFAAESASQERVYAFFHASFEEYFAALAIDDWDYFLPRSHVNKPLEGKQYRIFEPQWKEVILLWLGREDVGKNLKEGFIKALVEFKDGCGDWNFERVDRGFYEYLAYQLAAVSIVEFKNCDKADEIVKAIVRWGFGYSDLKTGKWISFLSRIRHGNIHILSGTDRTKTIAALMKLIATCPDDYIRSLAAKSLGEIADPGNPEAIATLIELIRTSPDDYIRWLAAESLQKIDPGNPEAIATLIELRDTCQNENIRWLAAESLQKIDPGNPEAIATLIELIRTSPDRDSLLAAIESLGKIGQGNPEAIATLIELRDTCQDDYIRWLAAESLQKIDPGNPEAIATLIELRDTCQDDYIRWLAAESLQKIDPGNPEAIATLIELIRTSSDRDSLLAAIESLGKIGQGNPEAIATLIKLIRTSPDENTRRLAARTLGEIADLGNPEAIAVSIELIRTSQIKYSHWQAAENLGKIGQGNPEEIAALIELIRTSPDENTRRLAVRSLGKIIQDDQMAGVITALQDCLSHVTYENDWEIFELFYEVIWKCAQTLSYPEFYQAWLEEI